jgi:peptide deformylase
MAVRPIVRYPDPRLRAVAAPVTAFGDALRTLTTDLLDTMREASGIGITAPHIGVSLRVVVLELSREEGPTIYINPTIAFLSDEKIRQAEGSVSMPGVVSDIERPAQVRVRYQDLSGAEQIARGAIVAAPDRL